MNVEEKVRNGLKCCTTQPNQYGDCTSADCPYKGVSCFQNLMDDALALLKAQEPRVMTLYEVAKMAADFSDCILWFEPKEIDSDMWFMAYAQPVESNETDIDIYEFGNEVPIDANKNLYGKKWRCWTTRPTDAQREATQWNG